MIKEILKSRWLPWALVVLLVVGLGYLKKCPDKPITEVENKYIIPTEVYRPPIIRLPFVKYKPPIPYDVLPIPPTEVDTSITVTVPPTDRPVKIGIIIGKDGRIYKTKDTPDNVIIDVVKWKEPFVAPELKLNLALTYSQGFNAGLSVDVFRVWELHLGPDLGISQEWKFMAGLHVKYHTLLAGYDFLNGRVFMGVTLKW